MAKKLTIEEVRQFVQENSDCELLSTEYVNAHEKLKFKCRCGEVFETPFSKFKFRKKNQCNDCGYKSMSEKLKKKPKDFMVEFENVSQGEYVLKSQYINNRKKIKIIHSICGEVIFISPDHFLRGVGCSKCAGNQKKTTEKFFLELLEVHDSEVILCSQYERNKGKVLVYCNKCTSFWEATPNNLLKGSGCPNCKVSRGERKINMFLAKKSITFLQQFYFHDCINKQPLLFDFAVFSDKSQEKPEFLIEYDGIQHFELVDFFGGQEQFEKQQLHDRIKDDYCKQNGIELIRIPYWEQDNIEEILTEKLSSLITDCKSEEQHCLSL